MTEREELLEVIKEAGFPEDGLTVYEVWEQIADAILAAGYRKPQIES